MISSVPPLPCFGTVFAPAKSSKRLQALYCISAGCVKGVVAAGEADCDLILGVPWGRG
ncbi:MAG: hypothetical protein NC238_07490 [Dehalobacter sp.]|nr:hypothetical protein [Dehalobacter sp.]